MSWKKFVARALASWKKSAPRKPLRGTVSLEALEERRVLSCALTIANPQATFNCTAAHDTIEVDTVTAAGVNYLEVTVNGSPTLVPLTTIANIIINAGDGQDTVRVRKSPAGRTLAINTGNDSDTVEIGYALRNLTNVQGSPITVNAGTGSNDRLFIRDDLNPSAGQYRVSAGGVVRGNDIVIGYQQFDSIELLGSNLASTYTVLNTPTNLFTLVTGNAQDTVEVRKTTGSLVLNRTNSAVDQINLGDGGSLAGIQGGVVVGGPAANSAALAINGSADAVADTVTLTATTITGLAPANIVWGTGFLRSLEVRAGSGGNTFHVNSTPAALGYLGTTLYTGVGTDSVYVRQSASALTLHGQSGLDQVNLGNNGSVQAIRDVSITNTASRTAVIVNDSSTVVAKSVTLDDTSMTGMFPSGTLRWVEADVRSLTVYGGSGGNTYAVGDTPENPGFLGVTLNTGSSHDTVRITQTRSPLAISAGAGNDSILLTDVTHTVDHIKGSLTVDGGIGTDTLTLDDQGELQGNVYTMNGGSITRSGQVALSYTSISTVNLWAGSGPDAVHLQSTPAGTNLFLDGRAGQDLLFGPDADTVWNISTSIDNTLTGSAVPGTATYRSFSALLGGDGDDTFRVSNGFQQGYLSGGGGAHNRLDYSGHVGNVYVNLTTDEATGAEAAYNIQDVTGSPGDDVLVGNSQHNILEGRGGRDLLIAGGADYSMQPDILTGGTGEDILIAGFTAYDTDRSALEWLRDVWVGPESYEDRTGYLSMFLNNDTVFSNYAGNLINGGGIDRDWFFLNGGIDNHDLSDGEVYLDIY